MTKTILYSKITDEENIALEVNDEITKKKETWKDFWKDEYDVFPMGQKKTSEKNLKNQILMKILITENNVKKYIKTEKNLKQNEKYNSEDEMVEATI